jgi:NAD(P)-dependent dehydrogenase (short-subunit alcohol dehydrogenase family)
MKIPQSVFDMSGRRVLVTGGGTGLGQRFAHTLAAAGATVILAARRADKLEQTARTIREAGGIAHCVAMDVASAASVAQAFAAIAAIGPLDVLVNNAGVAADKSLLEIGEDDWDMVMDANLKGAWLVARAAAGAMIANATGGAIVNIASILGSAVQKRTGPYSAAKAGLLQLTRAMALEWARHGIRVNAIAPGYYRTDMATEFLDSVAGQQLQQRIPQRRLGNPEELDGAILLLASGASSYMTGSVVTVDGGLSLAVV